jgi:hypothetical protein
MLVKKYLLIFALLPFTFTLLMGCASYQKLEGSINSKPEWIDDIPPEGFYWGIGVAKTESDGESILLAEDRARADIVRQIGLIVSNMNKYYVDEDTSSEVRSQRSLLSDSIRGSTVIKRYKDKNGCWWCLVYLRKEISQNLQLIAPINMERATEIMRINIENMPKAESIIIIDKIPEWVLYPYKYVPFGTVAGVGAAKLDNDEDAIYLARERARRSMTHSISADIHGYFFEYSYDLNNQLENYKEENISVNSIYDSQEIEMHLLNLAKTKDGTWWVMLGCETELEK